MGITISFSLSAFSLCVFFFFPLSFRAFVTVFFHRRSCVAQDALIVFLSFSFPSLLYALQIPLHSGLFTAVPPPPTIACTYYQKNSISQNRLHFFFAASSSHDCTRTAYLFVKTAEIPLITHLVHEARTTCLSTDAYSQSQLSINLGV